MRVSPKQQLGYLTGSPNWTQKVVTRLARRRTCPRRGRRRPGAVGGAAQLAQLRGAGAAGGSGTPSGAREPGVGGREGRASFSDHICLFCWFFFLKLVGLLFFGWAC